MLRRQPTYRPTLRFEHFTLLLKILSLQSLQTVTSHDLWPVKIGRDNLSKYHESQLLTVRSSSNIQLLWYPSNVETVNPWWHQMTFYFHEKQIYVQWTTYCIHQVSCLRYYSFSVMIPCLQAGSWFRWQSPPLESCIRVCVYVHVCICECIFGAYRRYSLGYTPASQLGLRRETRISRF